MSEPSTRSSSDGSVAACAYELDAEFRIRAVDRSWSAFALANAAPELASPGPLGRSIFEYLRDKTTAHLYRQLFVRVRRTGRPAVFPFRCDSPDLRRFLEMEITALDSAALALETRVVRLEPRAAVHLLDRTLPRDEEWLVMCSWCKTVEVEGGWCEVEDALGVLRLFERETLPNVTHGICSSCRQRLEEELE
jgi:hypothetical protein